MAIEILSSTETNVSKFKEIYEQDRFKARIFALENLPQENILTYNFVSPGNFQIFRTVKTYGVSKTLKLYARKKDFQKYIVSSKGFYKIERRSIFPICLSNLDSDVRDIFIKNLSWVRFIIECRFDNVLFNTVQRYKLYSRDKVLRHIYGVKPEIALKLKEHFNAR